MSNSVSTRHATNAATASPYLSAVRGSGKGEEGGSSRFSAHAENNLRAELARSFCLYGTQLNHFCIDHPAKLCWSWTLSGRAVSVCVRQSERQTQWQDAVTAAA